MLLLLPSFDVSDGSDRKSADSFQSDAASKNGQSNLGLKGIIGIAAMAKIAEIASVSSDKSYFNVSSANNSLRILWPWPNVDTQDTATSYLTQWMQNAMSNSTTHIDFLYGQQGTNGLIYNIYADKLLQLGFVPESVYNTSTQDYANSISDGAYGLPLDSDDKGSSSICAFDLLLIFLYL